MTALRGALLLAASVLVSSPVLADEMNEEANSMRVDFDQSTLINLESPAKTVIVGNPAIADAQLVNAKAIYVVGRMFGQTNMIALDDQGREVLNTSITVGVPNNAIVTLYRGAQGQRTLACSPRCERTMTQGDTEFQGMSQDAEKKVSVSETSAKLGAGR